MNFLIKGKALIEILITDVVALIVWLLSNKISTGLNAASAAIKTWTDSIPGLMRFLVAPIKGIGVLLGILGKVFVLLKYVGLIVVIIITAALIICFVLSIIKAIKKHKSKKATNAKSTAQISGAESTVADVSVAKPVDITSASEEQTSLNLLQRLNAFMKE